MNPPGERDRQARYIYGVIPRIEKDNFGPVGIMGNTVYSISYKEISALVHDCPPEPYQGDEEEVKGWVAAHAAVVDAVWAEANTVLPMSFDVIVQGDEERSAEENVRKWLEEGYATLKAKLEEFSGKVELGVQILWDPAVITQRVAAENEEIKELVTEMAGKSPGIAYFYQHKVAEAVKDKMEKRAAEDYRNIYEQLRAHAVDTHINKVKRLQGKQMIMNLSLLVERDKVQAVGEILGKVSEEEGVEVRFTGPWPPYTFAAKIAAIGEETEKRR